MHMVGHKHKLMELQAIEQAVFAANIEQEIAQAVRLQEESSLRSGERNEKRSKLLWRKTQG
jgi:hypothetical protein